MPAARCCRASTWRSATSTPTSRATLVTDRDGRFVALQLPPGRYTVTFKLSGFATLVQEDVLVTVGEIGAAHADA